MYLQLLHEGIAKFNGYEINTEGDSFQIAFTSVAAAVQVAMETQVCLLDSDWPKDVLKLPACGQVRAQVLDNYCLCKWTLKVKVFADRRQLFCVFQTPCQVQLKAPYGSCPAPSVLSVSHPCISLILHAAHNLHVHLHYAFIKSVIYMHTWIEGCG